MKNFKNKVIVITGAGSGIGRALAIEFSKLGAHLALNDYNLETLNETVAIIKERGVNVFSKAFDVSDKLAFEAFSNEVIAHFEVVDVVINNAGIAIADVPFHKLKLEEFERVMNINFKGVLYGSHLFLEKLLYRPEAVLVNVSSIFGLVGIAFGEAYCTSKFAVSGLTQSLIQTYKDTSITIHAVHPSGVNTNINKVITENDEVNQRAEEFGDKFLRIPPQSAAKTIINGIRKGNRKILIGIDAQKLALGLRINPSLTSDIVNNKIKKAFSDESELGL